MIPVAFHFNGAVTAADMCCLIAGAKAQIDVLNQDIGSLNSDITLYTAISAACPASFHPSHSLDVMLFTTTLKGLEH